MKLNQKKDNRNLSLSEKQQMRSSIVRLHLKGKKGVEIVDLLGVNKNTVVTVLKQYRKGGMEAVRLRGPGACTGQGRVLSPEQERSVKGMIRDRRPEQLKLDFALWSRQAVVLLIEQQFGISMPVRTVGDYLKRWGFTLQKPLKRAYEQQPAAVRKWLDEQYPEIEQSAARESAEIH